MTSLARRAAAASKRREGELARVRGPAVPGDLIILPSGTTVIHWLIVKTHPDDENLLFAVLADDNPETGPGDLRVPREHPWGPITLRCGFGLWIESELIDPPRRAGLMGEELVGSVRKVLGELAAGTLVPTPEQAVLDQDPDFQEWLDELEKARDAAMAWAEAAGTVCDREQMAEETPPRLLRFIDQLFPSSLAAREGGIRDRPASARAAAAGSSIRDRIARRVAAAAVPRWMHFEPVPGLYLAALGDGVTLVWTGAAKRRPRVRGSSGEEFPPEDWLPAGKTWKSKVWPWTEGRVVLNIGPGAGRRLVIRK